VRHNTTALALFASLYWFSSVAIAQTNAATLEQTISALDSALFNAVNQCAIGKVDSFWADDAEFLHDKNNPTYGRQAIVASIKNNLCGKVTRELVSGSLEVYPLQGYGAVEIGVHRFVHSGAQDHGVVGEAKFIHVWRQTADGWKITRVISYDHHIAK